MAIDGLNEAPSIKWTDRLREALDQFDTEGRVRVIVTVRSGYRESLIAPTLRHHGIVMRVVPPLGDAEFDTLTRALGFRWQDLSSDVRKQLRKPRLLVAAARIRQNRQHEARYSEIDDTQKCQEKHLNQHHRKQPRNIPWAGLAHAKASLVARNVARAALLP